MSSQYIHESGHQASVDLKLATKFKHIPNFSKFWEQAQAKRHEFDWQFYVDYYTDLEYLTNYQEAYEHWILFGRAESRLPNLNDLTKYLQSRQLELPTDFDAEGYWVLNLDLRDRLTNKYQNYKATEHFLQYGRHENRVYQNEFDWEFYLEFNDDLVELSSYKEAYDHWLKVGYEEERYISYEMMAFLLEKRRFELPENFDVEIYLNLNPDLKERFQNHRYKADKTIEYFLCRGRYEQRVHTLDSQINEQNRFSQLSKMDVEAQTVDVRLIAFYLPQFHPIPENDRWWGKGFTEWTNVAQAKPLFEGHYQPHIPADLGFYDLRLSETRTAQAELAKKYGIHGFCYYYYWFAGKRLLNRPLDDVLASQSPDFPFCICWANENWTRRWDGQANEILIAQDFSDEQNQAFAESIVPILKDQRYIRIHGRPLVLIYRADILPNALDTTNQWREIFRVQGVGEVHLAVALTCFSGLLSGLTDPGQLGFDSAVQFAPHEIPAPEIPPTELPDSASGKFYDYRATAVNAVAAKNPDAKVFLSAMPSWDNTARRKTAAHAFLNSNPLDYEFWLKGAIEKTRQRYQDDERIVFINAWNEWAEGAHLEPDQKYGHSFLMATHQALHGTSHWTILIKLLQYLPLECHSHLCGLLDQLEQRIDAMNRSLQTVQQLLSQTMASVTEVVKGNTDAELLWNLDSLKEQQSVNLSSIELRGWAIGIRVPICRLEVRCCHQLISQIPLLPSRPDVVNHFSDSHSQHKLENCGFYAEVDAGKIARKTLSQLSTSSVELNFHMVMQDGCIVPAGIVRFAINQLSQYKIQVSDKDKMLIEQIKNLEIAAVEQRYALVNRLEQELTKKEKYIEVGQSLLQKHQSQSFFEKI